MTQGLKITQGVFPVPPTTLEPPVVICLLGGFRVLKEGKEMCLGRGGKREALLVRLALRPNRGVRRETLVEALWPYRDASLARQSLNTLVCGLHQLLRDCIGGASPVLSTNGIYRLNVGAGVDVDTLQFEALVRQGELSSESGKKAEAFRWYNQAIDCYSGDMEVDADISALIERERLRAKYLTVLARTADYHYGLGQYSGALDCALRLLSNDPCREDAHRLVMRCHLKRGERAQALRQFQLCSKTLREEFNIAPEAATIALYDQLRFDPETV